MTSLADRTISALRTEHDTTAAHVSSLDDAQLTGPSGAAEWTVAQVLSHLGSGAEITLASLQAAIGVGPTPGDDFNSSVWDRWNAMSPAEQRDGYVLHGAAVVAAFEALDADQRESTQVQLGFVPFPLTLASFAAMRLNETAQHGWDVRVGTDPQAGMLPDSAAVLLEHFQSQLGFLLGFVGKPDAVDEPVTLDLSGSGYGIAITDTVTLVSPVTEPTATFAGPLESAARLLTGRLRPEYTSDAIAVTGNVTLDQLRAIFPGY